MKTMKRSAKLASLLALLALSGCGGAPVVPEGVDARQAVRHEGCMAEAEYFMRDYLDIGKKFPRHQPVRGTFARHYDDCVAALERWKELTQ